MAASNETKDLLEAGRRGDVEYLRKWVDSTNNKPNDDYHYQAGNNNNNNNPRLQINFLHEAATAKKEDFIREAVDKILPLQLLHQLLTQQRPQNMCNPLHIAASSGNLEIVKLFLKRFQSSSSSSNLVLPWLQKNDRKRTPCAVAILEKHEDCALEILEMDIQKLVNITDDQGSYLLYEAVVKGFDRVVWKIFNSGFDFPSTGLKGYTSLHFVTNCTDGEEICRELLKRSEKDLIKRKTVKGLSILHSWAKAGKRWPFECLLKCAEDGTIPDIKRVVVELMCADDCIDGNHNDCIDGNPLHFLANHDINNEEEAVEIAKLLIDTCKQQEEAWGIALADNAPWFAKDMHGRTPLAVAIGSRMEKLALRIISVDIQVLKKDDDAMFLAIENGCHEVAEMILKIVDEQGWTQLLTNHHRLTALHVAPKCKGELCKRLLKSHPEFIRKRNKEGMTILHEWVKIGEVWPFEYVLHDKDSTKHKLRRVFIGLISITDENEKNNPLHIAATVNTNNDEAVLKIAKLLVEAHREEFSIWQRTNRLYMLPWFSRNGDDDGPLHLAIRKKHENLALYILSLHVDIGEILDIYNPPHKTLFLAMENNCYQVAKEMLTRLDKRSWNKYLVCTPDGRSVMHLAPTCTDKDFGKWLVKEASEFITIPDNNRYTPLEEASNVGAEWIIKAMLENDPSVINSVPSAWVKACENGHVLAIKAFISNYPGNFKDHCVKHQDSPLHHIKLPNLTGYREFLKIPDIKDLINIQDSGGNTPLHRAILCDNKLLTEILLNVDDIDCYIQDDEGKTAIDLLAQVCQKQHDWRHMCKRSQLGFDPTKKLRYFPNKKKLLDARSILSTVAALLATITFAAGFTLPGGFDQNTGEAMLSRNAAFIIFLISDSLAMCCSMLILICVIMSIVFESSTALLLIDRSVKLLILTFYCTLLAFMTGVYTVISAKSLWVAVLIIVMCSLGVLIAHIILLPNVLAKLTPRSNRQRQDQIKLLEEGEIHSSRDFSHQHTT